MAILTESDNIQIKIATKIVSDKSIPVLEALIASYKIMYPILYKIAAHNLNKQRS